MFRSILQHLRFPFSLLLLPIFLFALSEIEKNNLHISNAFLLFIILHVLVYPSSNAYNSLQDNDQGSIGLVRKPLPVVKEIELVTIAFDVIALSLSFIINVYTMLGVLVYVIFSRLYSYRKIRLKKYPLIGFLVVFFFQGFWIFSLVLFAVDMSKPKPAYSLAICASCLIGAVYPLSQIYQHQQDKDDGVVSMSCVLGYKGTFLFSGMLFLLGTILFVYTQLMARDFTAVIVFTLSQLPLVLFFLYWFYMVSKNNSEANFKNTMRMNILSAVCMNSCFIILYFCK